MSINDEKIKTKRIQIVFTLDNKTANAIVKLNKECRSHIDGEFYIDGKSIFPHITIYSAEFPTKSLIKIQNDLKKFSKETKPLNILVNNIYQVNGTLMLGIVKDELLKNIHKNLLLLFNPYREGVLREKYSDEKYLKTLTKRQVILVKKYGYQYVLDYYKPHITFMVYDEVNKSKDLLKYIKNSSFINTPININLKKIGIFETGNNGTCIKKISEYSLK